MTTECERFEVEIGMRQHQEIAAILGVPEGTVWSRLHLARKRLAALLAEPALS